MLLRCVVSLSICYTANWERIHHNQSQCISRGLLLLLLQYHHRTCRFAYSECIIKYTVQRSALQELLIICSHIDSAVVTIIFLLLKHLQSLSTYLTPSFLFSIFIALRHPPHSLNLSLPFWMNSHLFSPLRQPHLMNSSSPATSTYTWITHPTTSPPNF